jgi:hypothetical protein
MFAGLARIRCGGAAPDLASKNSTRMTTRRQLRLKGDWRSLGQLALLLCALCSDSALRVERAKTDIVTLQNGDRITCRILYVQYSILRVNSVHTGDISIEWPSVRSIRSSYSFRVEQFGGKYLAGVINTDPEGENLVVGGGKNERYNDVSREARLTAQLASTRASSGDNSTQTEVTSNLHHETV